MASAYLIPIKTDLFDIARRLHEIDANYLLFFNKRSSRYEVHNSKQQGNTLAVTVPYETLDARTLTLVRQTRAENAQRLFDEIEKHNQQVEKQLIDKAMDGYAKDMKL